jgi:hypothetical protein
MSFNVRAVAINLILFAASLDLLGIECNAAVKQQQTSFCEEGSDLEDNTSLIPVPLPPEVTAAVMNSEEGKHGLALAAAHHTELVPAGVLKGAPVQLSNSRGQFFIVMGSGWLNGADNTSFWIVRQSGHRARVLLWTGAICVNIEPRKTRGYNDVESDWSSPQDHISKIYKFNGKSYKLRSTKTEPNDR